ncbi:hypothetical protein AF79_01435 [Aliarcobacter butzleri L354]|nr:hypothetical protein AF79_01435 [Aliarcobacter butzleri L354]
MFDIFNIFYILIVFLIVRRLYKIKYIYILFLLVHLFSIFLFNGFLFEPSYMPDQFKYLEVAKNVRAFDFLNEENFTYGVTVYLSGVFFGLFPIPFIDTIYSICMINFLLYFIIFIFLYKKGFLNSKFILWFYLFYPSLAMYSSLALRDMLIFFIMFLGIYYIIVAKRYLFGFAYLSFLFFIKFQNLLFFVVSFFVTIFFSKKINVKHLLFGIITFIFVFLLFIEFFSIDKLNYYRLSFYNENLSNLKEQFIEISSYLDLLIYSLPSIINFLFHPLPWKDFNLLKSVQFLENCTIFILIIYILLKNFKYKLFVFKEVKFMTMFLLLTLLIYGVVIYNSGTAARYKFPIITIYIIYSWYFIYQAKQLHKENKQCAE